MVPVTKRTKTTWTIGTLLALITFAALYSFTVVQSGESEIPARPPLAAVESFVVILFLGAAAILAIVGHRLAVLVLAGLAIHRLTQTVVESFASTSSIELIVDLALLCLFLICGALMFHHQKRGGNEMTPNNAMKRTSAPVTSFAYAKESPGDSRRLSRR